MQEILTPKTPASLAVIASKYQWEPAEHLLLLDNLLVQASLGEIKNLMIFMPPRHGKSELTSKYYPAWFLGNFPD